MLEFDGVSAWVEINDAPLKEYGIHVDERSRTVRCYVACEENKSFSVHWRWQQPEFASSCRVTVDGQLAAASHVPESGERAYVDAITSIDDEGCEQLVHPIFGRVHTTDEETMAVMNERIAEATSSIKLNVRLGILMDIGGSSGEVVYDGNPNMRPVFRTPGPLYVEVREKLLI